MESCICLVFGIIAEYNCSCRMVLIHVERSYAVAREEGEIMINEVDVNKMRERIWNSRWSVLHGLNLLQFLSLVVVHESSEFKIVEFSKSRICEKLVQSKNDLSIFYTVCKLFVNIGNIDSTKNYIDEEQERSCYCLYSERSPEITRFFVYCYNSRKENNLLHHDS